ncbi:MAG: SIMPL domain-containing protein [Aeromonas sp.]
MWRQALICVALCVALPNVQATGLPAGKHLVVTGQAEYKIEPDMLTLSVVVSALDKAGLTAKQQVDKKVATFFGQLEALGIARTAVEAGNLFIAPEYQYPANQAPTLLGYRAQRQLAVKLYELDKLSQLLDTALAAGLQSVANIEYGLKDAATAKIQARNVAVKDAAQKAEQLAQAFGAKLGAIYRVNYQTTHALPYMARSVKSMAAMPEAAGDSYQQQTITLSDSVEAVYLLE